MPAIITTLKLLTFAGLVTWSQDRQTVAYQNKTLHLARCRAMNQRLLVEAWQTLQGELLLGLPDVPLVRVAALQDAMTEQHPDYSLVDDPRNQLRGHSSWLWEQIRGRPELHRRFCMG